MVAPLGHGLRAQGDRQGRNVARKRLPYVAGADLIAMQSLALLVHFAGPSHTACRLSAEAGQSTAADEKLQIKAPARN